MTLLSLALMLVAVLVTFYWPYLTGHSNFHIFDFFSQWQPLLSYVGARSSVLQVPRWNPFVLTGVPQTFYPNIFYPPVRLFACLSFSRAMAVVLVFHQLVCGIGTYLLVRDLRWGRAPAIFAGLALALSGMVFALQGLYATLGPYAWFPLALWALRLIGRGAVQTQLWSTIACSTFVGLMINAGQAEVYFPALLIMVAYMAMDFRRHLQVRRRAIWTGALRCGAIGIGILLAAPVILCMAEWARISPRSAGFPVGEVLRWSASWYDIAGIVLSQPLGDFWGKNPFITLVAPWYHYAPGTFTQLISSAYLGAVPVTLAIVGACDRRYGGRWLLISLLFVATLASLGDHTPIAAVLVKAFHLYSFRFPCKFLIWVVLSLVLLGARGVFVLNRRESAPGITMAFVLWCLTLALSGFVLAAIKGDSFDGVLDAFSVSHSHPLFTQAMAQIALETVYSSLLGLITCLIFKVRFTGLIRPQIAVFSVIALTVNFLMVHAYRFERHPAPADFYDHPLQLASQIRHLDGKTGPIDSIPFPIDGVNWLTRVCAFTQSGAGLRRLADQPYFASNAYARETFNVCASDWRSGISLMSPLTGQTLDHSKLWTNAQDQYADRRDDALGTLCQMTSTHFLAAPLYTKGGTAVYRTPPLDSRYFKPVLQDSSMNFELYQVLNPLPRAYFAAKVAWGQPHEAILEFIEHPQTSHFDPHQLTILEHTEPHQLGPICHVSEQQLRAATVKMTLDEPEHIVIDVLNNAAPNFLILNDQYYPGWVATVDRHRRTIFPANLISRAVYVEAGDHEIDFSYEPTSLRIGIILSIVGGIILVLLFILSLQFGPKGSAQSSNRQGT
jgi:hypothetical protein